MTTFVAQSEIKLPRHTVHIVFLFFSVAHMLVIEKDAVIYAFRPGPADPEKERSIIATLIDKKAQYWHKHRLSRKIRADGISGDVWIKPDLTKAERALN